MKTKNGILLVIVVLAALPLLPYILALIPLLLMAAVFWTWFPDNNRWK